MDIKGTKRGRVNIIDTESNIKTKMGVFNLDFDNEQHSVRFTAV